jgi:hypothetical protein
MVLLVAKAAIILKATTLGLGLVDNISIANTDLQVVIMG